MSEDRGIGPRQAGGERAAESAPGTDPAPKTDPAVPTRRQMLMVGAVAASAVVSIRPAIAATAASVMNCEIAVPDPGRAGQYVAPDGTLVPAETEGAFPGAGQPFRGEDVRAALNDGRGLPGTGYEQGRAYMNYIRRLQTGTSGFTCYASLQMPR